MCFFKMNSVILGISGSRTFNNYITFSKYLNQKIKEFKISCIVTGNDRGTNQLAVRYAITNKIKYVILHPDWKRHGNYAGFIQNQELVNKSDLIICFWDFKSKGTEDTIKKCRSQNKKCIVINPFIDNYTKKEIK